MSTKMQTIGREGAKQIREMLELVLVPNSESRGLKVEIGRITFSESGARLTLSFEVAAGAEERKASEASKLWNYFAPMLKLPQDAVGKVVVVGERHFQIEALNPKAPRFPVLAKVVRSGLFTRDAGKRYKLSVESIQKAIEAHGLQAAETQEAR